MNKKKTSIKNWADDDKPREKLIQKGVRVLSDSELIAILIGSGNREESAVELSKRILQSVNHQWDDLARMSLKDLCTFRGIGEAKAVSIMAAMELGRRRSSSQSKERKKITSSKDLAALYIPLLQDLPHEEFWVCFVNTAHAIIHQELISQGGMQGTVVDVRIILKKALEVQASSLFIVHNHPSGNCTPSKQDKHITQKLKEAAALMDIQLLDHLIIGGDTYFSFADKGLIL